MMKINQFLVAFVAAFPIILELFPAKAFNISYKYPLDSSNYVYEAEYTTARANKGRVWIDPLQEISPPSSRLLQAFKSQFPSYNFEASYTPIYGDFLVTSYVACPPAPAPGFCGTIPDLVGGSLHLEYVPKRIFVPDLGKYFTDFPDPETGKVRWVQWVTDNHRLNGLHGEK